MRGAPALPLAMARRSGNRRRRSGRRRTRTPAVGPRASRASSPPQPVSITAARAARATRVIISPGIVNSSAGEPDVFEAFLARHTRGGVGNGEKPLRRNRRFTLGADAVFAVRHAGQRDLQAPGALGQSRGAQERQFLLLDALGNIEEIATHDAGLRYLGLGV